MTQPHPDANVAPPGGYQLPAAPPYQSEQNPTEPRQQQLYVSPQQGYSAEPQQPYAGPQQPYQPQYQSYQPAPSSQPPYQQQPYAGPQQGHPVGPQQPYQQPQHQSYPPAPLQPQYQQQPPMPNSAYGYPQPKSKVVAGLLGIFLGGLGIHRFYLGFTKIAVIQLILTLVLGAFTFGIVCLWGVIEGIMIIAGSAQFQRDAHGVPLRD
jgi:TM2 domain-containing membrane protein YozV